MCRPATSSGTHQDRSEPANQRGPCMCHEAKPYPAQQRPGKKDRGNSGPPIEVPLSILKIPFRARKPGDFQDMMRAFLGIKQNYASGSEIGMEAYQPLPILTSRGNKVRKLSQGSALGETLGHEMENDPKAFRPGLIHKVHKRLQIDYSICDQVWMNRTKAHKPSPFYPDPIRDADADLYMNHRCLFCRWSKLWSSRALMRNFKGFGRLEGGSCEPTASPSGPNPAFGWLTCKVYLFTFSLFFLFFSHWSSAKGPGCYGGLFSHGPWRLRDRLLRRSGVRFFQSSPVPSLGAGGCQHKNTLCHGQAKVRVVHAAEPTVLNEDRACKLAIKHCWQSLCVCAMIIGDATLVRSIVAAVGRRNQKKRETPAGRRVKPGGTPP